MKLISADSIGITYAFDPSNLEESHVNHPLSVRTNNRGKEIFDENFFGNRLGITLGPLVYSHNYGRSRDRKNFKDRKSVFDLRETNGRISLRPGENITVNSIESIRLGEKWGAITLPRLTHATAGVVLSASYIDPLWNGVLVFHIVNHGRLPIELQIGEKIGACHFYEVKSTTISRGDSESFANKSHHFGQNWKKIVVGDADPFPQKKISSLPLRHQRILATKQFVRENWIKFIGGIGLISLVSAILWLGATMNDYKDLPAQVKQLQSHNLTALERAVTVPMIKGTATATQDLKVQPEDDMFPLLVFASPKAGNSGVSTDASFVTDVAGDRLVRLVTKVDTATAVDRYFDVSYVIVFSREPK